MICKRFKYLEWSELETILFRVYIFHWSVDSYSIVQLMYFPAFMYPEGLSACYKTLLKSVLRFGVRYVLILNRLCLRFDRPIARSLWKEQRTQPCPELGKTLFYNRPKILCLSEKDELEKKINIRFLFCLNFFADYKSASFLKLL